MTPSSEGGAEQLAGAAGAASIGATPEGMGTATDGVPPRVLQVLRCPICGGALARQAASGGLVCVDAGHRVPMRSGYLDASGDGGRPGSDDDGDTTARTFASFGYEWNAFDQVRDEDDRFAEIYFRDLDLDSLAGGLGLDAGCGKGRFTRLLAHHLDALVALDGSAAVEAAARNLEPLRNVTVVKADLRAAPVAAAGFDFVACLGVLHHLDDPHLGFERLCGYLAPGGRMLLYLYSRPASAGLRRLALSAAALVRRVTVTMAPKRLERLCTPIAWALYVGLVLPGRAGERWGIRPLARLPMSTYRDKPVRSLVLDTFDRLSAPVEHRYVWSELAWWFEEAGMDVEAARDETGWFVLARKPVAPGGTAPPADGAAR